MNEILVSAEMHLNSILMANLKVEESSLSCLILISGSNKCQMNTHESVRSLRLYLKLNFCQIASSFTTQHSL